MDTKRFRVFWNYEGKVSTCIIEENLGKGLRATSPLSKASIKKYEKDPENRNLARFKTLSKAILGLPKADRYEIWEEFRISRKIARWANPCIPKSR